MMRELEQARLAYAKVQGRKNLPQDQRDKYVNAARQLGPLVRKARLVQALEFLHSREEGEKAFLADLAQSVGQTDLQGLIKKALEADLLGYMALTRQVLEVTTWYRRYAEATLKDKKTKSSSQNQDPLQPEIAQGGTS